MGPKENVAKGRAGEKRVKEVMEPVIAVCNEESAQEAMEKIATEQAHSAPVTDTDGRLVGAVSTDRLNRKVGGLGHDPKTTQVKSEIEETACCFEKQTVAEAEQVLREAKVQELPVVNEEKRLLGKTNLQKLSEHKPKEAN